MSDVIDEVIIMWAWILHHSLLSGRDLSGDWLAGGAWPV